MDYVWKTLGWDRQVCGGCKMEFWRRSDETEKLFCSDNCWKKGGYKLVKCEFCNYNFWLHKTDPPFTCCSDLCDIKVFLKPMRDFLKDSQINKSQIY